MYFIILLGLFFEDNMNRILSVNYINTKIDLNIFDIILFKLWYNNLMDNANNFYKGDKI